MSYELIAILTTSMLELGAVVGVWVYLGRQSKYIVEHMGVTNRYLADQVTVVGQRLAEEVKTSRQDLEAQLRRNAYLQTLTHDWSADRLKEILALLQKGEL
jgi:hypothetical protein